jgi:hypothetical protein
MKAHLLLRPDVLKIQKIGLVKWQNEHDDWEEKGCDIDKQLVQAFIEESPNITKEQKEEIVFSTTSLMEKYHNPGYATQYIIAAIETVGEVIPCSKPMFRY